MSEWSPDFLQEAVHLKGERLNAMRLGLDQLHQWLQDLLRQGLANAGSRPPEYWHDMAARMVDAKLGGIARRLRSIPEHIQTSPDWPQEVLQILSGLYLICRSFDRLKQLPLPLQAELLSRCGVNFSQKKLREQSGTRDQWLILGQIEGLEENLRYRRSWVLGLHTHKWGLILDFAFGDRDFEQEWPPGSLIEGEAVYFPAALPQRLVFREGYRLAPFSKAPAEFPALPELETFQKDWQNALAQNPWLTQLPVLLQEVTPSFRQKKFSLSDRRGNQLPLGGDPRLLWSLIALSGGRPLNLFGEFSGSALRPLSVPQEDRLIFL